MAKNRIEWYLTFATAADKERLMDKAHRYKATLGRTVTVPEALEHALDAAEEHQQICRNRHPGASNGPPPRWSDGPGAISDGPPDVSGMGE